MDYKFLDKVLDQIVSETEIDYDRRIMGYPFFVHPFLLPSHHSSFFSLSFHSFVPPFFFTKHCRSIYGLNDDEVEYLWDRYKKIIKGKIIKNL